jgi:hypothetical protein
MHKVFCHLLFLSKPYQKYVSLKPVTLLLIPRKQMLKLEFLDFWKMFMIIKDATIWFEINNMLFFFFVPATVKQKLQFKNLLRKQKMIWTILNHNVSSPLFRSYCILKNQKWEHNGIWHEYSINVALSNLSSGST